MAIAAALLIAQAGEAPAPAAPTRAVTPDWLRKATGEDLARVYPRDALRRRIEGVALVSCQVTKKGEMADCRILRETPENEGFGEAALKLMPYFLMRPPTRGGVEVAGAKVVLPIRFGLHREAAELGCDGPSPLKGPMSHIMS